MARLTTLAEDMEAIGLLPKREPKPVVRLVEAKKTAKVECDDDEEDDDDDDDMVSDDDDTEEGVEGDDDDEVVSEDGDEVVDEARRIAKRLQRTKSGAYRLTRTKRASASTKRAGKKRARSAAGKKSLRLRKRRMKTSKYKRFATKLAAKHGESLGGMGRVANLLDDVQRVLKNTTTEGVSEDSRKKIAHAFAQLALTADTLATKFESLKNADLDEVREELLADLREMASDYGEAAIQIRDGQLQESEENLSEAFEEDVRDLLGLLEVYDDCTSGKG